MKSFSTSICFRCLDQNEAREEAREEIKEIIKGMKKIGKDYVGGDGYEPNHLFIDEIGYNQALDDILLKLGKE
jgi:hypothetical protein